MLIVGDWTTQIGDPTDKDETRPTMSHEQVLKNAVSALEPEGTLLAVHWRHPVSDYPRSGDDVHRVLAAQPGLARLIRHEEPDFLAEVWIRTEGRPVSVAQSTGLA